MPPTLYLIDGHAQMFRAFFAIRGGMTSPVTGEPTNALFAFTGMLLKLYANCKPDYAAIAFDANEKTFRDHLFPDYNANRDSPPEEFEQQIPRMFELARLFGLPLYEQPGYEADDLMATVAKRLTDNALGDAPADLHLRLVAKDKDLEQTINDRVTLYDVQEDTELDAPALHAKRGIHPNQVIDYQTLLGDATDNVPGVPGIGAKTAAKLLDQFGSLDALIAGLDQLKGKQKERLTEAIDSGALELSRKLVTLDTAVDFPFDLDACHTRGTDNIKADELRELFRNLGFNRHVDELSRLVGTPEPLKKKTKKSGPPAGAGGLFDSSDDDTDTHASLEDRAAGDYTTITDAADLDALAKTLADQQTLCFDTETTGNGIDTQCIGVSLAWETGSAVYLPIASPEPDRNLPLDRVLDALRPALTSPSVRKVAHNLKYDAKVLALAGLPIAPPFFDTMVAAFLLNRPGLSMDDLALAELGHTTIKISELIGQKPRRKADPPQKTMDQVPLAAIGPYAAEDADITLRLHDKLAPELDAAGMTDLAADTEMPLIAVLADMELAGIRVDPAVLDEQRATLEQRIAELRAAVLDAAGVDFNPDSPKQLGDLLFNQLGFAVVKRTKTGYSTDSEVLETLTERAETGELNDVDEAKRTIPALILEYRMLTKLVGTYLVALKQAIATDGRVHTRFSQVSAATGRLASNDPNLQNIPIRTDVGREIRRAFVAEPGHQLIAADYSQIELRMLAHLAEDDALTAAFRDGQDIHAAVAAEVFDTPLDQVTSEQRGRAKVINFGIIYGITAFGLARRIDGLSREDAASLIDNYKKRFAGIDRFMNACVEKAQTDGYVETILGRRRPIDQVHARNPQQRALGERLAINSVVQGSAADLIKRVMVNLHRRIADENLPMRMLLQIHDELVVEAPQADAKQAAAVVTEVMQSAMDLRVPLVAEAGIGNDWHDAK
ncbi:MAG: DNA polymerase I [Planctomycetota bacterium]